jgi:4-hydroxy-3-methylbut-2-en-1-yl diphosphate synthase IspG/GcpE
MTSPAVRSDIAFNIGCSAALHEEIGDRLRISLTGEPSGLSQHMTVLVEQIARTDGGLPYVAPEAKKQNAEVAQ